MANEIIHPQVLPYFPNYDYNKCVGDPAVICNMKNPGNMVGHQQRAFSVWWALKCCSPMDLGIDVGSSRSMTPYCIHVDLYGTGLPHPYYGGGGYHSDVLLDGSDLSPVFPKNTFPLIVSNHSLEHMPATQFGGGDKGIIEVLKQWISTLRQGGILAMIIPDNDHFDVMACDKDHKHAWGHSNFRSRVLDRVIIETGTELVEYDTLKNNFSFNVVLRKI